MLPAPAHSIDPARKTVIPTQVVGRVALPVVQTPHSVRYLRTKRDRMGHQLETGPAPAVPDRDLTRSPVG